MKFGYFDDANKEYVITSPRTPYPWINYLGGEIETIVATTAAGASDSAKCERLKDKGVFQ